MTPRQQERALERRRAGIALDREMERRYPHLGVWHEAEPTPEALLLERIARTLENLGAPGSHPLGPEVAGRGGASQGTIAHDKGPSQRQSLPPQVPPITPAAATKAQMERLMELRLAAGITDAADLPRFLTAEQVTEAIISLESNNAT